MLVDDIRRALRAYPDFPGKGIVFQDVAPLLRDPALLRRVVDAMAEPFAGRVDKVAGVESRGFILGPPIALKLGVGFVPVRKAGKLPREAHAVSYSLEYGEATLEVHADAFTAGQRVLVVDDVLATGGTAAATLGLIAQAGGMVTGFSVLLELQFLGARSRLEPQAVHALLTV